jgi:hypothetical protein
MGTVSLRPLKKEGAQAHPVGRRITALEKACNYISINHANYLQSGVIKQVRIVAWLWHLALPNKA